MQYYIKIFNKSTNDLIGYYKTTGKNCITRLPNGMKYFDSLDEALDVCMDLDEGFVRDKDKHYYTAHAIVYGDANKQSPREPRKSRYEKEEELKNALDAFIRKNSSKDR